MPKDKKRVSLPTIRSVGDIDNPRSTVLYGNPGTGKTTLAATWPKPILYVDVKDKGTDSIADVKDVDVMEVEHSDQMEEIYWEVLNKKSCEYASVVVDTVTQLQEMFIRNISGKKDTAKWGALTRQQFGEVSGQMKGLITDWRDLDMEVVFIAQQRMFDPGDDDISIAPEIGPALMPSIASHLNASVNTIGQTFVREKIIKKEKEKIRKIQFCLRVAPDGYAIAKIRKPRLQDLPEFLINPTYEDLIDIIKGDA